MVCEDSRNFFTEMLNTKIHTIMEEFLKIFEKDIMSEGFSTFEMVMMGIVGPMIFVIICILVSLLP